jgi:diaminohydroxyphosphoribosylaminopyrimidine deaminase/5-amino-6-(5-phosphoribosylamino)uracil reductase
LRVILDSRLRTPPAARLLGLPGETLILTGAADRERESRLRREGISIVTLPMRTGRLDLAAVLTYLGRMEINEIHLEAGPTLSGSLLAGGWVDELLVYLAPHLMGDTARGLFSLPGLERMDQRIGLTISDIRAVGRDWRITAAVTRTPGAGN